MLDSAAGCDDETQSDVAAEGCSAAIRRCGVAVGFILCDVTALCASGLG